jgi:AraC-like DNA-binding protein/mannose-6-phosphate isomerase-like protein (cupin superfamily)
LKLSNLFGCEHKDFPCVEITVITTHRTGRVLFVSMRNLPESLMAPRDLRWRETARPPLSVSRFAIIVSHREVPLCVRRELYEAGTTTGEHRHEDFCALYLVRSGRGLHVVNNVPYGITRGDVYLLPPGATHEYRDYRALEIDAFYFRLDLFNERELSALRELSGLWTLMLSGDANRIHLTPETHRGIEAQIEEIRAEYSRGDGAAALLLHRLFFRLLVFLARRSEMQNSAPQNHRPQLADVLHWCEAHLEEPISVAQLAAILFISPGHFSTLFTREVGMPPAAYLRRLRLEKARGLLDDTSLSITQAAQRSGFSDMAHFSRSFRAFYGVSPRDYRRSKK